MTKKQEPKPDSIRVINCCPDIVYNGRVLTGNAQGGPYARLEEYYFQSNIIKGKVTEYMPQFQKMITSGKINSCSRDTFQLLHDVIAGKIHRKEGRPAISYTKKIFKMAGLAIAFEDQIKKPGMNRKKALDAVVKHYSECKRECYS